MVRLNNISAFVGKFLILSLFLCIATTVNAQDLRPKERNGKYGYVNNKGEFIIQPQFYSAGQFTDGFATVQTKKNGKYGLIDKAGNFVIKPKLDWGGVEFSEGLAVVRINGKFGYIDKTGSFAIQLQFDWANKFYKGLATVKLNGKEGLIDQTGEFVIQPKFDELSIYFSDGLLKASINGKYGYIDKTGEFVIQPQFDDAKGFSYGLAPVKINHSWGYINTTGEFVIQPQSQFCGAYNFSSDGTAMVYRGGFYTDNEGYIDREGNFYETKEQAIAAIKEQEKVYAPHVGEIYTDYIKRFVPSWKMYLQNNGVTQPTSLSNESIKSTIENEINRWQQKGEFESSSEWQQRVNEETRTAKINEITSRIQTNYSKQVQDYNAQIAKMKSKYEVEYRKISDRYCSAKAKEFAKQDFELKPYDADNETFLISSTSVGDIMLPVPKTKAAQFKSNWNNIKAKVEATFVPIGDDIALKSVTFGDYTFDGNTKANYAFTNIDYNFAPIEISNVDLAMSDYNFEQISSAPTITVSNPEAKTISATMVTPESRTLSAGSASDVDLNIPQSKATAKNTFAIVIANENYQNVERVENAANDGKIMAKYLTSTLGIPQDQVMTYTDASYGNMIDALDRIKNISQAYSGSDYNVIFYYAGHGVPDEQSHEAYLLPIDGKPGSTAVNIPLSKLYATFGDLGASAVYVMLDACFSGSQRGDGMLAQARGVAIKAKAAEPKGNMVVLSAAQGDETAYPYKGQNHGMFTYYLLKKLQESSGNVTIGELADYVIDNVKKTSVIKNNGKIQTPTVRASLSSGESWRNNKLVK
jgi:hypothetical protein